MLKLKQNWNKNKIMNLGNEIELKHIINNILIIYIFNAFCYIYYIYNIKIFNKSKNSLYCEKKNEIKF